MWRLVVFLSAVKLVDSLFYAALAPLLPHLGETFDLTKAEAGLLVAVYAVGWGVGAIPAGLLASRLGVRPSTITGLTLLAATSVAFGFADGFEQLLASRLLQGVAAALCFASALAWMVDVAPRSRRGEMIGILAGAAAAGAVLGPVVGAVAVLVGRDAAFAGVASIALALAIVGLWMPAPSRAGHQTLAQLGRAHRSRQIWTAQWLLFVPGVLLGAVSVLAPLQLSRLGWGPVGIAGTFLAAALAGILARPLVGRWADQRGLASALRLILLVSAPLTLACGWAEGPWLAAVLVVLVIEAFGVMTGPAMALVSHVYDSVGVTQVMGFALMALAGAVGLFAGSAGSGEIAHRAGDASAYAVASGLCLITYIGLSWTRRARPRAA